MANLARHRNKIIAIIVLWAVLMMGWNTYLTMQIKSLHKDVGHLETALATVEKELESTDADLTTLYKVVDNQNEILKGYNELITMMLYW